MHVKWWNNNKCLCDCKIYICEKCYVWNPSTCSCENGQYLASFMIQRLSVMKLKGYMMRKSILYKADPGADPDL